MGSYSDKLQPSNQVRGEEKIAAMIFDFQRGQVELDEANACEDHTLTEEDCQELGRSILLAVLSEFRPDLFEGGHATPEETEKARELYARGSSDNIEIDDMPMTSVGDDGTWVQAWVFLAKEDDDGA